MNSKISFFILGYEMPLENRLIMCFVKVLILKPKSPKISNPLIIASSETKKKILFN